jgi:hypothetical protein
MEDTLVDIELDINELDSINRLEKKIKQTSKINKRLDKAEKKIDKYYKKLDGVFTDSKVDIESCGVNKLEKELDKIKNELKIEEDMDKKLELYTKFKSYVELYKKYHIQKELVVEHIDS